MNLEFHPEAEVEIIEATDFYEREVAGLGKRFEAAISRATDLLLRIRTSELPST